jgi:prepilin-type N-terminal cleavage/methylation domain-containing protein
MAKPKPFGFTMLEVLVAVTILAMICAIVYASFVSVADTSEVARQAAADLRFQQYIYNSFSDNMSSIYTDPPCLQPTYALLGEDESGPFGSADSITFCTSQAMPGAYALPGVLRQVRYELVPENEEAAGRMDMLTIDSAFQAPGARMMLQITETPLAPKEDDEELSIDDSLMADQARVRQIPVHSLGILYYDGYEEAWVEDWDSVELKRMPWAIEVHVNLARTEDQLQALYAQGVDLVESPDILLQFPVPVGAGVLSQFPDMNHLPKSAGEEASGDTLFNEETQ